LRLAAFFGKTAKEPIKNIGSNFTLKNRRETMRKNKKTLRVVVLFSGGASSLKYLLEHDPNCGKKYKIVGAFTDTHDAPGASLVKQADIELECLDIRDYFRARNARLNNPEVRKTYFAEVSRKIQRFQADLLILCGFMRIVVEPLLGEYRNRILNVHPADLTLVDENRKRKYIGSDAVSGAISAGEKFTRSTIHFVTEDVDGGPIVTISDPLPVEPGVDPKIHQEKMKWACDGPAYAKALALIADGNSCLT